MKFLIANWKQNGNLKEVAEFCRALNQSDSIDTNEIILSFPFVYLSLAQSLITNESIKLAGQCVSPFKNGAHTGHISAEMLKDVGCKYAIIGHSERRQIEDITSTMQQFEHCIKANIKPILCVGETMDERNSGKTENVLSNQLLPLKDLLQGEHDFVIAYEPRWAIGSGLTPNKNEIRMVLDFIKEIIDVDVVYGGSVSPKNINELLFKNLSGFLVGSASLSSENFLQMADSCIHCS
jgi:triosephosphate isomerase